MAWGYCLNMEKLALEIVDNNIQLMTYDNWADEDKIFIDNDKFINNLKYGYICITMLASYIESSVNTILRDIINYNGENLLKGNLNDKLEIIYLYFNKDISKIRSNHLYGVYKEVISIRNELIHYKDNYLGMSTGIPTGGKSKNPIVKKELARLFTKENMVNYKNNIIKFIEYIAKDIHANINSELEIISCDGMYEFKPYIYK